MVRGKIEKKIFKGQIEKNKMIEKTKLVRGQIRKKSWWSGLLFNHIYKKHGQGQNEKKMIGKKWLEEK